MEQTPYFNFEAKNIPSRINNLKKRINSLFKWQASYKYIYLYILYVETKKM